MSKSGAWILRLSAAWSIWVWAVLVRNMAIDHTHAVGFRVVHITLAVISFAFAFATLLIVRQARRSRAND